MRNGPSSFCWFDYETFGISPVWDRPAQFAAIRTDDELNPLGEPTMLFCRQTDDYLPHPAACRVTDLTPGFVNERGLPENRFIDAVVGLLGAPGTCSVGYNSVRFDDEFTRHTLFRNLADSYEHEWKDGASRWDLLDVVRLTRALRPDGIEWPVNADGRASNKLEDLAAANDLAEGAAHDALVDVRATLALARLLRARQPKLFAHTLAHRDKRSVGRLLDPDSPRPVVLVSSFIPAERHHLAVVQPLARHPDNPNAVIVLDLADDPSALVGLDIQELIDRRLASGKGATSSTGQGTAPGPRLGLHSVALNKCPVVAPLGVLRPSDAERLGIDLARIQRHAESVKTLVEGDTLERIRASFGRPRNDGGAEPSLADEDVDGGLYRGGFLSADDRARRAIARRAAGQPAPVRDMAFDDPRLPEMVFRFRARNHPELLDEAERARWHALVRARLQADASAPWLGLERFETAMAEQAWQDDEQSLRRQLSDHAASLRGRYLNGEPQAAVPSPASDTIEE